MSKRNISSDQEAKLLSDETSCVTQTFNSTMAPSHPAKNDGKTSKRQNSSLDEEPTSNNKRQHTGPSTSSISAISQRQTTAPNTRPIMNMAELLESFQPLGVSTPAASTNSRLFEKPIPKKTHTSNNKYIDAIVYTPRPKPAKKKKSTKQPKFTIFEDETATLAANPSPIEITTDPESRFFEYNDEAAVQYNTSLIRIGTKKVMQKVGMKYATCVMDWLAPLAIHLDAMTPFTGRSFEDRVDSWRINQEHGQKHGVTHPNGFKHTIPHEEEEWFTVECVEELADLMQDVQDVVTDYMVAGVLCEGDVEQFKKHHNQTFALLTGYCLGFGRGMDIGGPVLGDYLEDGRRNPEFFRRLTAAWTTITELYMEVDFTSCVSTTSMEYQAVWAKKVREKIGGDMINWGLMEHFWGDSFPPCHYIRMFGGKANRDDVFDPYGAERYAMGVDQLMYE
ncbi:hypothetical protein IFR05_008508 [Cadophora sp. M221]|nr:hypothetical protein IFR05_008508 [Cadophora sp. M221]